jgi:hexulose-6-phosphate isomerase
MSFYKALNYWVYGGFSGEKTPYEMIDFVKAQGLDGAELTVPEALPLDITEEECRKIKTYADAQGIGIRSLATGAYWGKSLGTDDEAVRAEAMAFTRKYLQIANWIGAETVLVVPGATCVKWDPSVPVIPYETVWRKSVESLNELLPLAERLKVNIALENVWGRFLLSPMEWRLYLDQFGSERIGIYFDMANCLLYAPAEDYIRTLGKRVKAIHIKNWSGEDCGGGLHGFGDDIAVGEANFPAVKAELEKIGYTGPISAEMIPFCRLPDMVLPDQELAEFTCKRVREILG